MTLRVRKDIPSLRGVRLVREIGCSLRTACNQKRFRLIHYSIQSNHLHLIVEAADAEALGRGMMSIASRLARAVNRVFARTGKVLSDRYHSRVLKTPREVRNALAYVLLNARRPPASSAPHARASTTRGPHSEVVLRGADAEIEPASASARSKARCAARFRALASGL